ncbi:MAG: FAD-dependent oxidoreductase [Hyphomicrobiales bacterium]|nr:FAD-dependent oxidoreductase [Hyphomicrobiales bacterium]
MFKFIKKILGIGETEPPKPTPAAAPEKTISTPQPVTAAVPKQTAPAVKKAAAAPQKVAAAKKAAAKKTAKPAAKKAAAKKTAKPAAKKAAAKKAAKPAAKKAAAKKAAKPVAKKAAAKKSAKPAAKKAAAAAKPRVAAAAKKTPAAKTAKPAGAARKPAKGKSLKADYVIVGAGPAGVAACETLREQDAKASIILLSGETEPPYSRMAIPYVLTGMIEEPGTYLRKQDDHYKAMSINVHHASVDKLDTAKKIMQLSDGGSCAYGKLLIATGASPVKPPVKGLDLPGVHHCWTLEDARAIAQHASQGSRVVLMGAGFIGCIILEAIAARGTKLTVVEAEDRMVPRMMNDTAGNLIKKWCQEKGMTVHTSTRVSKLSKDGDAIKVEMDNGKSTQADLVVVATGVRANTSFLKGSKIKLNEGIVVDDRLESSVAGVYAAGDCAEGPDFSTGGWSVHAIQPTATEHGRIAALNMAGRDARYKGSLNMNVLDTAGLISSSFGEWQGVKGGQTAETLDGDRYRYTQLAFDGDRLVGALTLGRTENIGILRGLIQSRTDLGVWKDRLMEDPNRITEAYIANTH